MTEGKQTQFYKYFFVFMRNYNDSSMVASKTQLTKANQLKLYLKSQMYISKEESHQHIIYQATYCFY